MSMNCHESHKTQQRADEKLASFHTAEADHTDEERMAFNSFWFEKPEVGDYVF